MGYDLLTGEVLSRVDWDLAKDDLEREITQLLEPRIRKIMPAETFCYIQHEPKERETRKPAPAQPPEYDLAFILYENERIMWPIEAKVLSKDLSVGEYVKDVKNEFLTCRYAPFSDSGAMIGYLLSGDPNNSFSAISNKLQVELTKDNNFKKRPQRISYHIRSVPKDKNYPKKFFCYHLILEIKSDLKELSLPIAATVS